MKVLQSRARSSPARSSGSASVLLTFFALGGYTLTLQIVLARECFLLFSGNELSIAIQFGLWLSLTSLGGAIGAKISEARIIPWLLALLPLTGLWAVGAIRFLPILLPVPLGQVVPLFWALVSLMAALGPLNLMAGILFPSACRMFAEFPDTVSSSAGRFYILEALGSATAGAAFTFLIAGRFRGIDVAVWSSAGAALMAAIILRRYCLRAAVIAASIATILSAGAAFGNIAGRMDDIWWTSRFPNTIRLLTAETRYQRIEISRLSSQLTVFINGSAEFTLDENNDLTSGRRMADFFLALHPNPERVLVVGEGEPGLPTRILEYPSIRVTYATLDLELLSAVNTVAPESPFGKDNPRLAVISGDGRSFLTHTRQVFDLIILDLPSPVTISNNRIFTAQAFAAARSRLAPGGVLVFQLPSSSQFIAGDTAMLLSSVKKALEEAFGNVNVLASDTMIFVASIQSPTPILEELADRFAERNVPVTLASGREILDLEGKRAAFRALFEPWFSEFRLARQLVQMQEAQVLPNDDMHPVACYLNLLRWLREMGIHFQNGGSISLSAEETLEKTARNWPAIMLCAGIGVGVTGFRLSGDRSRRSSFIRVALASGVWISGCAGMLGQLVIIFIYQNRFGVIYEAMGALFATYMLGLVMGGSLSAAGFATRNGRITGLLAARGLMICSCAAACGIMHYDSPLVFYATLFGYSLAFGFEYPVANRAYQFDGAGSQGTGLLHSMDHLGAATGALFGATFVLPMIGARDTLLAIGGMHMLPFIAFGILRISGRASVENE